MTTATLPTRREEAWRYADMDGLARLGVGYDLLYANTQKAFVASALAGFHSPIGIDAAFGAEYFFTTSFSLGAEVLGIRFHMEQFDRNTKWTWHGADSSWNKSDMSVLCVTVIVKTSDEIATMYPAYVNLDHLSDKTTYGVDVKLNYEASQAPSTYITNLYTALQSGSAPSYDVMAIEENYWAEAMSQPESVVAEYLPSALVPNADRVVRREVNTAYDP